MRTTTEPFEQGQAYHIARLLWRINWVLFPLGVIGAHLLLPNDMPSPAPLMATTVAIIGLGCLLWWGYHRIITRPHTRRLRWVWWGTILYNTGLILALHPMLLAGAWFILAWQAVVVVLAVCALWSPEPVQP
jgi:hypothetical protein